MDENIFLRLFGWLMPLRLQMALRTGVWPWEVPYESLITVEPMKMAGVRIRLVEQHKHIDPFQ